MKEIRYPLVIVSDSGDEVALEGLGAYLVSRLDGMVVQIRPAAPEKPGEPEEPAPETTADREWRIESQKLADEAYRRARGPIFRFPFFKKVSDAARDERVARVMDELECECPTVRGSVFHLPACKKKSERTVPFLISFSAVCPECSYHLYRDEKSGTMIHHRSGNSCSRAGKIFRIPTLNLQQVTGDSDECVGEKTSPCCGAMMCYHEQFKAYRCLECELLWERTAEAWVAQAPFASLCRDNPLLKVLC